jgi:hypothetical protein
MADPQVSIQQAMANALVTYLGATLDDVTCRSRWPDPSKNLPEKAITVVPIGRRQDQDVTGSFIRKLAVEELDPPDPYLKLYTFARSACIQPIQLDVWAIYDYDRDDIVARLDDALSANLVTTAGVANDDPVRDGVLLPLSDGFGGYCDFTFDGPLKDDSPDAASRAEFRATYTGTAAAHLTKQITLPTLTTFKLRLVLRELFGDAEVGSDTYTLLTSGGISHSSP